MNAPTSTYRVQIRAEFGFGGVEAAADYLQRLGITHVYLSPVLQACPGSEHGYDVVDHQRLSSDAGGEEAFWRMLGRLDRAGLRVIADVVPNHMSVPTPLSLNRPLWSMLRDGPQSPFARWFDVNWAAGGRMLLPVLGSRIAEVVSADELRVDRSGDEPVLRYYDHEFPLRAGTADLPLAELLEAQWYRLAWWRVADDELNYRRFFDVDTLAAIRVEDPAVFEATHRLIAGLVTDGRLSGLRIDHPDGLADPRGYLRRLSEATGGTWVAVEKILEDDEVLPADWECAGTTGYDALNQVGGLFVDPAGAAPLSELLAVFTGGSETFEAVVDRAKRLVTGRLLRTEVERLVDVLVAIRDSDLTLHDLSRRALHDALVELLVAFDRYRAYVVPGESAPEAAREIVDRAARRARGRLPEGDRPALDAVHDLVLDGEAAGDDPLRAEFVVRFQQACGPVMAKGLEDTTFYRYLRLLSLNEVGGDPDTFGVDPDRFHAFCTRIGRDWPATMTTLSTHDTKRSEDARARLAPIAELTHEWGEVVRSWHRAARPHAAGTGWPDAATEYLFWQTLVAIWADGPPAADRLVDYLTKATREAKLHTSWTSPDAEFDDAVTGFVRGVLADQELLAGVAQFCNRLAAPARVAVLGQKLVQLTMPGVADVYQGTEVVDLSVVDPDNRRPVDYGRRAQLLDRLDATGTGPGGPAAIIAGLAATDRLDAEKLLVTSRALRLRRDHPDWFVGGLYRPLPTTSGHAVAFGRGPAGGVVRVVTIATRLPVGLDRDGGWDTHEVTLPGEGWTDVLNGGSHPGGTTRLTDLLTPLPVALLVRP